MIGVSVMAFLFCLEKKVLPTIRLPTSVESFPMTLFDLNQTWKMVNTGNCYIRNFSVNATIVIYIQVWEGISSYNGDQNT